MSTLTEVTGPLTKKRLAKDHRQWLDELEFARSFAAEYGFKLFLTDARHQVAKLIGPGVKLVIYPHRTSSFNYHLRIRDEGSADKDRAAKTMALLDHVTGSNCTFGCHHFNNLNASRLSWELIKPDVLAAVRADILAIPPPRTEAPREPK
jgi:hypothetical protein